MLRQEDMQERLERFCMSMKTGQNQNTMMIQILSIAKILNNGLYLLTITIAAHFPRIEIKGSE